MQNNPTERLTRAADDWHNADPDIQYAVERGLMRDLASPQKHATPNVSYASFWPALVVCLCIVGVVGLMCWAVVAAILE